MIKELRLATIWSEDLNNLLPFYQDTLGMFVGLENDGFVILGDPNGTSVALGTHSEVHGPASDPHRHIVGVETDDIDAEYKRLKGEGAEFLEEPSGDGAVRFATLKDPEGNLIQLLQFVGTM